VPEVEAVRVSIVIPARNEPFLGKTVEDVLRNARGDVEVIVVLDGYWPDPTLAADPRVHIIHRGKAAGMRPAINAATAIAKGDFLMKLDAHCMMAEGFDVALAAECADDWIVVPRRYPLDPEAWCIQPSTKPPIDYHYLSYPLASEAPLTGLHGSPWRERGKGREDVLLDDEMSSQGSCWFMSRKHWDRLGPMEIDKYGNFIQEFQELGLKTWLGGGAVKVNKRTWYAHLHKGKTHGRGYFISKQEMDAGADFAMRYWTLDRWAERRRDLRWLIEKFAPVPTWPADLDAAFARAREVFA
jgi:glycosyltransferase involved in cell wall biosynthesis